MSQVAKELQSLQDPEKMVEIYWHKPGTLIRTKRWSFLPANSILPFWILTPLAALAYLACFFTKDVSLLVAGTATFCFIFLAVANLIENMVSDPDWSYQFFYLRKENAPHLENIKVAVVKERDGENATILDLVRCHDNRVLRTKSFAHNQQDEKIQVSKAWQGEIEKIEKTILPEAQKLLEQRQADANL